MKTLLLSIFCLSIFPVWAEVCSSNAKTVLSSSPPNQWRFIESGFLSKLFGELIDIVQADRIVIENDEVSDIIFQFSDDARNPRIINLFEVANFFGVSVSDLFKHYGSLEVFIDSSGIIASKESFTSEKKYRISERIHLHLSGLIDETLRKKNLTLKELALQTSIKQEVFHHIAMKKGIPRSHSLLQILVRLDADVVDFFKSVEAGLEQKSFPGYFKNRPKSLESKELTRAEKYAVDVYGQMKRELKEIFEGLDKENLNNDVTRFKNMIYRQYYKEIRHRKQTSKRQLPSSLTKILQTARMVGMRPSELLKHVGDLKSHVRLDGIGTRTFLNDEEIEELLSNISKHLLIMFNQSGMELKELAEIAQLSSKNLEEIIHKGLRHSYSALERILQALNTDAIRFFEKLESMGELDVHVANAPSLTAQWKGKLMKGRADGQFMGERILKIREILLPISSVRTLDKFITRDINTNTKQNLPERDIYFQTFYKASRVANISLSKLASEQPLESLVNPRHAKLKLVSRKEMGKAKRLLTHLLISEVRRQNDMQGLTVMGLGMRSHLAIRHIRRTLSGELTPSYSNLRQIVEDGLNIPLPQFLEGFEFKLKSLKSIPVTSKKVLLELEGLYVSKNVKTRMRELRERIDLAIEFFKSIHLSLDEVYKRVGIRIRPGEKKEDMVQEQIYTAIRFCHFFGISLKDFLGHRDFAELVDASKLNFERLSEDRLISAVGAIKHNINQRRNSLNLPLVDLTIMLGAPSGHRLTKSLFNESVLSFPWYRYFQLSEILAEVGEDDFFLLDGIEFNKL